MTLQSPRLVNKIRRTCPTHALGGGPGGPRSQLPSHFSNALYVWLVQKRRRKVDFVSSVGLVEYASQHRESFVPITRIPQLHALRPSPTFLTAFLLPLRHSCFFGVHGPEPNAHPSKYPDPSFAVPGKPSHQGSPPPRHLTTLSRCPVRSPCWIERQEGANQFHISSP